MRSPSGAADRPEDVALVMRRIEQEGPRMGELVGPVLLGDPMRLRQVVDNLLADAREHTAPRTPVHVSLRAQGTDAVLD